MNGYADETVVPSHEFVAMEAAARSRNGKIERNLVQQASEAASGELLAVDIFVDGDYREPSVPFDGTDVETDTETLIEWLSEQRIDQAERIAAAKAQILDTIAANGGVVDNDFSQLPLIQAHVPAGLLTSEAFNAHSSLITVTATDNTPAVLYGYAGRAAMNEGSFVGGNCGSIPCDGGNLPIGIWELDDSAPLGRRSAIATYNDRLDHQSWYLSDPTFCVADAGCPSTMAGSVEINHRRCENLMCVEEHVSYVAASLGMIGTYNHSASDTTQNAPPATTFPSTGLWSTRYVVGNDNGAAGLNYVLNPGTIDPGAPPVLYVNRSASNFSANTSARYAAEWAARNDLVFFTAAGGNSGAGNTVDCAAFRNGLCVGGYRYETYSSMTTHDWWTFSNPDNGTGNPERPHLLGPATHTNSSSGLHVPDILSAFGAMRYQDFNTAAVGGPYQILGTSFAAPAILASAVQAYEYEGFFSTLIYPVVNKAVLLASTRDVNNDGEIGTSTTWSNTGDSVDGAGQLDLSKTKAILDANSYASRNIIDSDFTSCGSGCREWIAGTVPATGVKPIRAALVYNACTTAATQQPALVNDLDLTVVKTCNRPNGLPPVTSTTTSATLDSETEMIHILADLQCTSVSYSIRVRIKNGASLQGCGSSNSERIGVAWSP